mmetsp:Transcript_25573/g.61489  ORF Transcript_25573/g.61489 Transcript_25573/m.61489 type:complete len:227 (+) Transcript_25573:1491-2171(+)
MPPRMQANLDAWKKMNGNKQKGTNFVFFDDDEQRDWMEHHCPDYWPAWRDMELPAARADLFRYCLLYTKGGVWSDIDMVPELALSEFVPPTAKMVLVHDGGMPGEEFLYNAFLASVPGHPVLRRVMDIIMEHYRVRLRRGAMWCTGPHVLWRAVNDTLGGVPPKSFVGFDEEHEIEYLSFDGNDIVGADGGVVLKAKYKGYHEDARWHGGEPHFGREVTWSTKALS